MFIYKWKNKNMFQCVMLLKFLDFMLIQSFFNVIQIKLNTLKTESGQHRISFISIQWKTLNYLTDNFKYIFCSDIKSHSIFTPLKL